MMSNRRSREEWYKAIEEVIAQFPNHGAISLSKKIGCSDSTFRKYANEMHKKDLIVIIDKGTSAYPDYRYFTKSKMELAINEPVRIIKERLVELRAQYDNYSEAQDEITHRERYARWRGIHEAIAIVNDVLEQIEFAVKHKEIHGQ
jgi:hypothetical protein